jgi:hypothetical protein
MRLSAAGLVASVVLSAWMAQASPIEPHALQPEETALVKPAPASLADADASGSMKLAEDDSVFSPMEPKAPRAWDASMPETDVLKEDMMLAPSRFDLVEVNVTVNDITGNPVPDYIRLMAFHRELGLYYPSIGTWVALKQGSATMHLPKGDWAFFVYGKGLFISARKAIDSDCSFTLAPDHEVLLNLRDFEDQPIRNPWIFGFDGSLAPTMPLLDLSSDYPVRPIRIAVMRGSSVGLIVDKTPPVGTSDGTAFCLRFNDIDAVDSIDFRANADQLASIDFNVVNADGEDCPIAHFDIELNDVSLLSRIPIWRDENIQWHTLKVWMTPGAGNGLVLANPDGWAIDFYPYPFSLGPGEAKVIRTGGRLLPTPTFDPQLDPKQVWVYIQDQFGGRVSLFRRLDGQGQSEIRLYKSGVLVDREPLYMTGDRLLSVNPTGDDYEIELDLGFFGKFLLSGTCFTPANTLQTVYREMRYLDVIWPSLYDSSVWDKFGPFVDSTYEAIANVIGRELAGRPLNRPALFGPGWDGGYVFAQHIATLLDPTAMTVADHTFQGIFSHELGHAFQGVSQGLSDFGGPSPTAKEAMASILRDEAATAVLGIRPSRAQDLPHRENFFLTLYENEGYPDELQLNPDPARFDEYWRYYFIIRHLTDCCGTHIHAEFARFWGDAAFRQRWDDLFEAQGFSESEKICATYSLTIRKNLAWLFTKAGFAVNASKIDAALAISAPGMGRSPCRPEHSRAREDPRHMRIRAPASRN